MSSIGLYSNGQMICQPPYNLNFEHSYYPEAYNALLEAAEPSINIHWTYFRKGYVLYMFFSFRFKPYTDRTSEQETEGRTHSQCNLRLFNNKNFEILSLE